MTFVFRILFRRADNIRAAELWPRGIGFFTRFFTHESPARACGDCVAWLVRKCSNKTSDNSAHSRGTNRHPIACVKRRAVMRGWGWGLMRSGSALNHTMDNMRFGPVVLGRGTFPAVVPTIMMLGLRLEILDLGPIRLMTALPISSARRGKCATANGNPEDSCEDQLLDVLVHCTTCTFLFTSFCARPEERLQ